MAAIDVLLPVKNGIAYLAESLDSVVDQTFADWRLLVLDHGSDDGSRELVERYAESDARIRLLSFPDAQGLSGLLNRGLEHADCDLVMRHDADDICMPDRMTRSLDAHRALPQCVVIGGQVEVIDADGKTSGAIELPHHAKRVGAACFFRNPIIHPTTTIKFTAIQKRGIRYGNDFLKVLPENERLQIDELAEDYFLFGQLAISEQCANVPATLIKYRWHPTNISSRRHVEQLQVTLRVARSLAQMFTEMHGLKRFDPAPFSNFGDALFAVGPSRDLEGEFEYMATALRAGFGSHPDVEREITFRHVVATRNDARLLWRYAQFARREQPDASERKAVRSWLVRRLSSRKIINVGALQETHDSHA